MVHSKIFSAKAFLVIAILVANIHTYKVKGNLPDLGTIIDFFQNILRHRSSTTSNDSPTFRSEKVPKIKQFINNKIEELMPFLQDDDGMSIETDNDLNSNNITLDGDDETTIVEFLPPAGGNKFRNDATKHNDSLKTNIEDYKKMRKKIKKALESEHVSEKTQDMVAKTLDSMIAELIENKCSWKGAPNGKAEARKTTLIARRWNKQWLQFKKKYMRAARSNNNDQLPALKLFKFFEQFHEFLSHIVDDTEKISDRYKIVCQFIERNEGDEKILRKGIKANCRNFKLCSGEMRSFLKDVYKAVNNTAVSAFRNYASMYVRDVNTAQSEEKESVVMTVNEIGDIVEHKIENIFLNLTGKLKLDKDKEKQNNIKIIKRYLNKMIGHSINDIKNNLGEYLRPLGEKLQVFITKDLSVNVDLDLNNLKTDLKSNLCERFSNCNGKYDGKLDTRRKNGLMLGDYNRNSVYVKVQLNLDDEMKDKLISRLGRESHTDMPKTNKSKHKKHKSKKYKEHKNKDKLQHESKKYAMTLIEPDFRRKYFDASVSRTTHQISTTSNVTQLKNVYSSTALPPSTSNAVTTMITLGASIVTAEIVVNKTRIR